MLRVCWLVGCFLLVCLFVCNCSLRMKLFWGNIFWSITSIFPKVELEVCNKELTSTPFLPLLTFEDCDGFPLFVYTWKKADS